MDMEGSEYMLEYWKKETKYYVEQIKYYYNLETFLNELPDYFEVLEILLDGEYFTVVLLNKRYKEEETNVDK